MQLMLFQFGESEESKNVIRKCFEATRLDRLKYMGLIFIDNIEAFTKNTFIFALHTFLTNLNGIELGIDLLAVVRSST